MKTFKQIKKNKTFKQIKKKKTKIKYFQKTGGMTRSSNSLYRRPSEPFHTRATKAWKSFKRPFRRLTDTVVDLSRTPPPAEAVYVENPYLLHENLNKDHRRRGDVDHFPDNFYFVNPNDTEFAEVVNVFPQVEESELDSLPHVLQNAETGHTLYWRLENEKKKKEREEDKRRAREQYEQDERLRELDLDSYNWMMRRRDGY